MLPRTNSIAVIWETVSSAESQALSRPLEVDHFLKKITVPWKKGEKSDLEVVFRDDE